MTLTQAQAAAELDKLHARLRAESARLDRRDAAIARGEAALRNHIEQQWAEIRQIRTTRALRAAQAAREGWDPPGFDWRSVLAEYNIDEWGRPVE